MDSQKAALVAAGAAAGAATYYYATCGTSEAAKPPPPPPAADATDNVICDEDVQRIVCYGDSNTWGLDAFTPGDSMRRFKHPWPRVLARKLGPGYDVVSEGLNGRTTIVDDPFMSVRSRVPCYAIDVRSTSPLRHRRDRFVTRRTTTSTVGARCRRSSTATNRSTCW